MIWKCRGLYKLIEDLKLHIEEKGLEQPYHMMIRFCCDDILAPFHHIF
jgi:hypothetical protein